MLEKAAKNGLCQSSLFVHVGNSAAIALYCKLGYEVAATLPNYYSSSPHLHPPDAHRMICRLSPSTTNAPAKQPVPQTRQRVGHCDEACGPESLPAAGQDHRLPQRPTPHDLDDDIVWPSLGAALAV
mmetsp:Transcript_44751/g.101256  ORF Transcript_44751/g.101256 Transcript_44751/m.101256 type:complete len:127 (+) Transcript_44751:1429-1809(+)